MIIDRDELDNGYAYQVRQPYSDELRCVVYLNGDVIKRRTMDSEYIHEGVAWCETWAEAHYENTLPTVDKVKGSLVGLEQNAYAYLAHFQGLARKQGKPETWTKQVMDKARNGDYDHLMNTLMGRIWNENPLCNLRR